MEINNDALINEANRIQKRRNSSLEGNTVGATEGRAQGQGSGQNATDQVNLQGSITGYLAEQLKNSDQDLRTLQIELTQMQKGAQNLHNLQQRDFTSGQEAAQYIGNNHSELSNILQEQGQWQALSEAPQQKWQDILQGAEKDLESSIRSIYLEVEKLIEKRNVELENITALGLPQGDQSEQLQNTINQLRESTNVISQGLQSQNVDDLISS